MPVLTRYRTHRPSLPAALLTQNYFQPLDCMRLLLSTRADLLLCR
jgi:hypothetical protein